MSKLLPSQRQRTTEKESSRQHSHSPVHLYRQTHHRHHHVAYPTITPHSYAPPTGAQHAPPTWLLWLLCGLSPGLGAWVDLHFGLTACLPLGTTLGLDHSHHWKVGVHEEDGCTTRMLHIDVYHLVTQSSVLARGHCTNATTDSHSRASSAPSTRSKPCNLAASASSSQGRSMVTSCKGGGGEGSNSTGYSESVLVGVCN